MVEQRTENPRVGGSIPPLATNAFSGNINRGNYPLEQIKKNLNLLVVGYKRILLACILGGIVGLVTDFFLHTPQEVELEMELANLGADNAQSNISEYWEMLFQRRIFPLENLKVSRFQLTNHVKADYMDYLVYKFFLYPPVIGGAQLAQLNSKIEAAIIEKYLEDLQFSGAIKSGAVELYLAGIEDISRGAKVNGLSSDGIVEIFGTGVIRECLRGVTDCGKSGFHANIRLVEQRYPRAFILTFAGAFFGLLLSLFYVLWLSPNLRHTETER